MRRCSSEALLYPRDQRRTVPPCLELACAYLAISLPVAVFVNESLQPARGGVQKGPAQCTQTTYGLPLVQATNEARRALRMASLAPRCRRYSRTRPSGVEEGPTGIASSLSRFARLVRCTHLASLTAWTKEQERADSRTAAIYSLPSSGIPQPHTAWLGPAVAVAVAAAACLVSAWWGCLSGIVASAQTRYISLTSSEAY